MIPNLEIARTYGDVDALTGLLFVVIKWVVFAPFIMTRGISSRSGRPPSLHMAIFSRCEHDLLVIIEAESTNYLLAVAAWQRDARRLVKRPGVGTAAPRKEHQLENLTTFQATDTVSGFHGPETWGKRKRKRNGRTYSWDPTPTTAPLPSIFVVTLDTY